MDYMYIILWLQRKVIMFKKPHFNLHIRWKCIWIHLLLYRKIHLSTCLNMQHTLTSCRMALPYYYAAAANHSFNTKYCCCPYSVVLSVLVFVIDSIVIRLLFRLIPRVNTSRKPKYKWLCAFYHSALIQLHQFNGKNIIHQFFFPSNCNITLPLLLE